MNFGIKVKKKRGEEREIRKFSSEQTRRGRSSVLHSQQCARCELNVVSSGGPVFSSSKWLMVGGTVCIFVCILVCLCQYYIYIYIFFFPLYIISTLFWQKYDIVYPISLVLITLKHCTSSLSISENICTVC